MILQIPTLTDQYSALNLLNFPYAAILVG